MNPTLSTFLRAQAVMRAAWPVAFLSAALCLWSPQALSAPQSDEAPGDAPPAEVPEEPMSAEVICEPIDATITSPANGATAVAPATFTVSATATASPCTVPQFQFTANGVGLYTDTAKPFTYVWSNVMPGTYAVGGIATDQAGGTATVQPVTVTVTSPISISLTSPANGAVALAPASFTLTAAASDSTGTITKVEFYRNGILLNTDTVAPYTYVWGSVPAGSYALTAKATDNHGISRTSNAINVVSNATPTVAMTAPANGATALAPASFTLSASASDTDGTISKVEFFKDGSLLNTDTVAPYTYVWGSVPAGAYALTAKATDNRNATRTSAAVNVSVNAPPTVVLTSPAEGSNVIAPASFTLTANASDADGSISKVEFYANGALINTDTVAPYTYAWTNRPVGNYALAAKAYDNLNATKTSATINVSAIANGAPTVALTAPANGATATAPANFTVTATASDADGSVARVEFFSNGALLATDTLAPYSAALTNLGPGTYALTAKATDNLGLPTTSVARTVTVAASGAVSVTRRYVYDNNQRLCKTIEPESGASLFDYDGAGNLAWSVDGSALTAVTCDRASVAAAAKTVRSYDARNRVLTVSTPGGIADSTTTYTPDGLVESLEVNNPEGVVLTEYGYNRRRMLTAESVSQSSPSMLYTLGYGYNGNGHLATLTYPDQQVVGYAPNALGQAKQVGAYASAISYYPNGAIHQFTYGNGVVHTLTQNPRLLPGRSREVKGTTVILDDTYDYDANGNVTDITDQAQGGLTTRGMDYDVRDRLTVAVAPGLWGDASYAYDGQDNLTVANQGTRRWRYSYAGNRLTQVNDANGLQQITLGYNTAGDITVRGTATRPWRGLERTGRRTGVYRACDGCGDRADVYAGAVLRSHSGKVPERRSSDCL